VTTLCGLVVVAAACGAPAPVPLSSHAPPVATRRTQVGTLTADVPAKWTPRPIHAQMRVADYDVGTDAEVIVYYFGENGIGTVDDNVDRWLAQFTQPDGRDTKQVATIDRETFAGRSATIVSVTGTYAGMDMGDAAPPATRDHALVAAIVDSAAGPYYFRLFGGRDAVRAAEPGFRAMLASLR
jgi:hypothetical protein